MIWPFLRRNLRTDTISTLYGMIVAQARMPCFYRDYSVADTVNGRFDLIVLHLTLLFHRLASEPEKQKALGQAVFDLFCRDMDHNLREMGVGDLAVPKKMQRIGAAFYGSLQAYEAALEAGTGQALIDAIVRNVEGNPTGAPLAAEPLASYMKGAIRVLSEQRYDDLALGLIRFPDPDKMNEH
ncbi:MAG TPA: ubiquinol-cytochrome C chaperone family protein, partial [Pseudolabrys sp.]|nr:ubiquinol-cytochrome C chaperone family protein [Pseudolabrys sp.]